MGSHLSVNIMQQKKIVWQKEKSERRLLKMDRKSAVVVLIIDQIRYLFEFPGVRSSSLLLAQCCGRTGVSLFDMRALLRCRFLIFYSSVCRFHRFHVTLAYEAISSTLTKTGIYCCESSIICHVGKLALLLVCLISRRLVQSSKFGEFEI
ncbi:hypothetical protein T4B_9094 [Trichinella pseudospiralis]|uniref:Uncharacterized protein n=2 Tax=Trichinella pseudospiralis TaxID=6337 RepID=A0A0V1G4N4_TRIPS|nr:hypothetical protein T4D_1211 [Trichinella pseudospiralis]KRZ12534.1 hypothetical protein T4B_9094 [Trichinella pseudospiralis]